MNENDRALDLGLSESYFRTIRHQNSKYYRYLNMIGKGCAVDGYILYQCKIIEIKNDIIELSYLFEDERDFYVWLVDNGFYTVLGSARIAMLILYQDRHIKISIYSKLHKIYRKLSKTVSASEMVVEYETISAPKI